MNQLTMRHPSGLTARVAVADLTAGGVDVFRSMLPDSGATIVYSDPPWNPGNEKYWRRFAGKEPPGKYDNLLDAWCACAAACNAAHVFCEQSVIVEHKTMLLDAVARCADWRLPLLEEWTVLYGSPKRPNSLLHFGAETLSVDPSGMNGERMTTTVLSALKLLPGTTIADPCTGLGTSSRVAHKLGCSFVGTELNPARLERTVGWLRKNGYVQA